MATKIDTAQRAISKSLRPKEAARFLGIGLSTFWEWTKTRPDFPPLRRLGTRCTIVDADELLHWRDAQTSARG